MLENSSISKQFIDLEKDKEGEDSVKKSFSQMHDILGQFLRYIHYILICSLHEGAQNAHQYPTQTNQWEEKKQQQQFQRKTAMPSTKIVYFDRLTYVQIIKVIQTLIGITPYSNMKKGLSTIIIKSLIENL